MAVKKTNTVSMVEQLAKSIADRMEITIWDVRFEKEGSSWFLRVLVDTDEGIDLVTCEEFSREMSTVLDDVDPIDQSYYLEIGSPGVERELVRDWHFAKYIGSKVSIRLIRPADGIRDFEGELLSQNDGQVTIILPDGTNKTLVQSEAAFIRLVDDYDYSASE